MKKKCNFRRLLFVLLLADIICAGFFGWKITEQADVYKRQQQMMAQDRHVVEEAYAGDIIGVFDPGIFSIGDTVCAPGKKFQYEGIPTFAPEHFARVRLLDSMKRKQFVKGINQIAQEGAIQIFQEIMGGMEEIIVGVVGVLQFDVLDVYKRQDYAVCAVATCEIGIDIQKIQSYSPRLLRRILTKQELLQLEQSEETESFFCRLWSQKESYVKWSGQGITRELDTLEKNAWQESFSIEDYWVCVTAQSACEKMCIRDRFIVVIRFRPIMIQ